MNIKEKAAQILSNSHVAVGYIERRPQDRRGSEVMELFTAIAERRSTRDFTPEPVDESTLRQLIKTATQAPSAMNEQPWHFTVVENKTVLSQISKNAKAHLLQEMAEGTHIDHFRQTLADQTFDIFYGAPALVVISAPAQSQWAIEDCALAAENLMLAAHAMKLGCCWIGFAQAWLGTAEGHKAIGLTEAMIPVAPIIVGHPKSAPAPVSRHEPKVHWIR